MAMARYHRPEAWRWTLAFGILIVSTMLSGGAASVNAHPSKELIDNEWSRLLVAFVEHDVRAKTFVDATAQTSKEPAVRALAAVLTQEWELSPHSDVLIHPRSVYVPKLTSRNEHAMAEAFLLKVNVSKDGHVLSAQLIKSPQQPRIAREVIRKVKEALFRPAFKEGRFVSSDAVMNYSVEVR
jgi:hypothetical protein